GHHTYSVSTKDKCKITGNFELDFKKDKNIEISFEDSNYPSNIFNSKKFNANLSIDGKKYKIAKKYTIPLCNKKVPFIIVYKNQSKHGTLDLKVNESIVKQFDFLSPLEIKTFNSSKSLKISVDKNQAFQGNLSHEDLMNSSLVFSISLSPKNGSIDLDKRGSFIYTPKNNFRGKDSFKYTVKASDNESPAKLVLISIVGKNNAPIALTTTISISQGEKYSSSLKAKDLDADQLTFKLIKNVKNGSLLIDEDGDIKYIPNNSFYGNDTFSYSVSDNNSITKQDVTIIVKKINVKPEVSDFKLSVNSSTKKEFKLKYSKTNAGTFTVKINSNVKNGELTCSNTGICIYKSLEEFSGEDSFEYYIVSEDGLKSDTANVTIRVEKSKNKLIQKVSINKEMSEKDYKDFENYLESLFKNKDEKTLFQIREKYPKSFERFIQNAIK
ncbi:MAG: Ig-like domain-containing protein, partial [Campylobacteraceae bacterium]|nr:Ig-like domain-containing protein [Campylobacteraceae bacterium]